MNQRRIDARPRIRSLTTLPLLYGQHLVTDEVESDHLWAIRRIFEVTGHGIAHHGPQLRQGFPFGEDGMPEGTSHKGSVKLLLSDFKNDFLDLHGTN